MNKNIVFALPFIIAMSLHASTLVIDTSGNDSFVYQPVLAAFNPHFVSFYNLKPRHFEQYDKIFVILDGSFLQAMHNNLEQHKTIKDPLLLTLIEGIARFRANPTHFLALAFPDTRSVLGYQLSMNLLKKWNMFASCSQTIEPFMQWIMQPDAQRSCSYDTSLLCKRSCSNNSFVPPSHHDDILFLPTNTPTSESSLHPLLPMGLYYRGKHPFFITKASILDAHSVKESFWLLPYKFSLQEEFCRLQQHTLHQLWQQVYMIQKPFQSLKSSTSCAFTVPSTAPRWWCAWTGLDAYAGKEDIAAANILQSGINLLWIELNPEWYLSKNGIKKEQKEDFFKKINAFTAALQQQAQQLNKPVPLLFVGTDLTSNFSQHPVSNPVVDIYGNIYSKVPSFLDVQNFWGPELIDVFKELVCLWPSISNGIALSGIFLDLEMYHAQQQTSHYSGLMDFSDYAWNLFTQQTAHPFLTVQERINYLRIHNLFDHYCTFHYEQMRSLGKKIKHELRALVPDLKIAAYDMTLPYNHIYKGFLAGLSSPTDPVILATFNTRYQPFSYWLEKNNIFIQHLPVVMLSKLASTADFSIIQDLSRHHHGVWFNRFERLEQSRDKKDWGWDFGLEVTPLSTADFTQYLAKTIQSP